MKTKFFCIGNAHLDPLWMWRWQEGSAEAKATIRSALDRMKEYSDFRFVCSSASVYQWIEKFDPKMFEEIRQRISEGRFIVVGGWFVQPDCNSPAGEGFARQALYSQRYFREKFGVTAKIGYNVDSFGHCATLPMILKNSGLRDYIYMRPSPTEMSMDTSLFDWIAPDGSKVTAYRLWRKYNFNPLDREELEGFLNEISDHADTEVDAVPFFYGVGNHGGGPTKRNIELLKSFAKDHPEKKVIFSDLLDFFTECRRQNAGIEKYHGELQHHASGCYSAVSAIKEGIRKSENQVFVAENYSVLAGKLLNRSYHTKEIGEIWKKICFTHFHDSMGGCCVADACDDILMMLGEARSRSAVVENDALQSLSWAIGTEKTPYGYPIVVFNPHAWEVEQVVKLNKQVVSIRDEKGHALPIQTVYSQTALCYERGDTIFRAKVGALGWNTYYLSEKKEEVVAKSNLIITDYSLENEYLLVTFDPYTGYLSSIYNKADNRELLYAAGAVPKVIDESDHDTWSHAMNYFDREIGQLTAVQMNIVENGPVRITLKVVSHYNKSSLTQYFSLEAGNFSLQVRGIIDWHEKHKMLKLAFPLAFSNPKAYYEIPFGVMERPLNGEEEPGQMWIAMSGDEGCVAMINDNKYSFSMKDSTMNLTVVRSPIYGDHGHPRSEEDRFTDQGEHRFSYALLPAETGKWGQIIRKAREWNAPFSVILENRHPGYGLPMRATHLSCKAENVIVSAVKRSEDGDGFVIRVYETDGKATDTILYSDLWENSVMISLQPWEVKTFYGKDGEPWQQVLFFEEIENK